MMPIFVISIPTSSRRPAMQKRMDAAGLAFTWWDAIDGRGQDPSTICDTHGKPVYSEARARLETYGRALIGGEVAVSETTFRLYRHSLQAGHQQVAILEDDAILEPHFIEALAAIDAAKWDGIVRLYRPNYDYVDHAAKALFCLIKLYRRMQGRVETGTPSETIVSRHGAFSINESPLRMDGAPGYTITAKAMRQMLKRAYPIRSPIDEYMRMRQIHGAHSRHIAPQCVTVSPNEIESEIRSHATAQLTQEIEPSAAQGAHASGHPRWNFYLSTCKCLGRWNIHKAYLMLYGFVYDTLHLRRYL